MGASVTLTAVLNQIDLAKQLLIISAAGAIIWYVYKGSKSVLTGIDDVTTDLAQTYVDFKNPLVESVLRIKPQYFKNGVLTDEAFDVISEGYPDVYRVAFKDRRLRPEWLDLDNGQPITNEQFEMIVGSR
jgi:hypothetical protein